MFHACGVLELALSAPIFRGFLIIILADLEYSYLQLQWRCAR